MAPRRDLRAAVQSQPIALPGALEADGQWIVWNRADREVEVPIDALERFVRLRSAEDVEAYARELGPLGLCEVHRLPHTHARPAPSAVWDHPSHELDGPNDDAAPSELPPARIVSFEEHLAEAGGEPDICRPTFAPAPGHFRHGDPRRWREPVEGWLALAAAVDALMQLGAALSQAGRATGAMQRSKIDELTSERWARLWPMIDFSPVEADWHYGYDFLRPAGLPRSPHAGAYGSRSDAEHDFVAANWRNLVATSQEATQRLANGRRCVAFATRRVLSIGAVGIDFEWLEGGRLPTARVGPATATLFGALALQAAVALSPGPNRPGLALCSGCPRWYQRQARVRADRSNYCDACRDRRAAEKNWRAGGVHRLGKRDQRLSDVKAWLLKASPTEWNPAVGRRSAVKPQMWALPPSYRCVAVEPGDRVYLWTTGPTGATPAPGIWAAGHIGETAGWRLDHEVEASGVVVPLELEFATRPVLRQELDDDPRFAGSEILRAPHKANPFKVTEAEMEAIEDALRRG